MRNLSYRLPIILIGPIGAGKSTVANELAKMLEVPRVPMDRVGWYYYFKDGFSFEKEAGMSSFAEMTAYWKPFEASAVGKIIAEFPQSIIDFGAGHSYFVDEEQFKAVKDILTPIPNIFLLLPNEDREESLRICNERFQKRIGRALDRTEVETNRNFIEHPSNYRLSKHVIYTKAEEPNQTAGRIIGLLQ